MSSVPVCVSPADCCCHLSARAGVCEANTLMLKFWKVVMYDLRWREGRRESDRADK